MKRKLGPTRGVRTGASGPRVIVLMGASGAGKTTVGRRLSKRLGWAFHEGDAFHLVESIEKMSRGIPLQDADRRPWLTQIRKFIRESLARKEPVILTCSALKRAYRRALRVDPAVLFVYLKGTRDLLDQRLRRRRGHYLKTGMLDSQLADLQEPRRALTVDAALPPKKIIERIVKQLGARRA